MGHPPIKKCRRSFPSAKILPLTPWIFNVASHFYPNPRRKPKFSWRKGPNAFPNLFPRQEETFSPVKMECHLLPCTTYQTLKLSLKKKEKSTISLLLSSWKSYFRPIKPRNIFPRKCFPRLILRQGDHFCVENSARYLTLSITHKTLEPPKKKVAILSLIFQRNFHNREETCPARPRRSVKTSAARKIHPSVRFFSSLASIFIALRALQFARAANISLTRSQQFPLNPPPSSRRIPSKKKKKNETFRRL